MKFHMLPRMTSMLAVWGVLLLWQLGARQLGDLGVLVFLLLLGLPVAMSGTEWAFCRRHACRGQVLIAGGWLDRAVSAAPLVVVLETAKALLLTLLLMTAALSLDQRAWAILLLDVAILALLMPRLPGLLVDAVKCTYLFALARRWAIWFSTLLLWGESLAVPLRASGDDYRGLSWRAALEYSMPDGRVAADGVLDAMLRLHAGVKGLGAWAVSVLRDGAAPDQQVAAVMVAVLLLPVALLVALAYSRALIGVLARPLAIWRPRERQHSGNDQFEDWRS